MGQSLLEVSVDDRTALLYPLLAERLAERLSLPTSNLDEGAELSEIARRAIAASHGPQDIHRELRAVFRELEPIAVPESLRKLADIEALKLYISTTFDPLTERALDQRRFDSQRQTLVFSHAPNDKQDLPREFDRLGRPTVFKLLGRFSGTPASYAITEEDVLEFARSMQSRTEDAPYVLIDKLRRSNLLILGSRIADWLTHFFVQHTAGGRHSETHVAITSHEPHPSVGDVLLLQHFAGGSRIFRGRGAAAFVDELHHRWRASQNEEPPARAEPGRLDASSGAVYLSYAEDDGKDVELMRQALDRAGVDVVTDVDDVPLAAKQERKLRNILGECALFVPIFSRRASRPRRFFPKEWIQANMEARQSVPSGRFVLPVTIDDVTPEGTGVPAELGTLAWERLPEGKASSQFLDTVVRLQRDYRSASFA